MYNLFLLRTNSVPPLNSHYGFFGKNLNCRKGWYFFLSLNKKLPTVVPCPSLANAQYWLRTRGTCNFPVPLMGTYNSILGTGSGISHSFKGMRGWGTPYLPVWGGELQTSVQPREASQTDLLWVQKGTGCFVKWGFQCLEALNICSKSPHIRISWEVSHNTNARGLVPIIQFQLALGGTRHQYPLKISPGNFSGRKAWEPPVNQRPEIHRFYPSPKTVAWDTVLPNGRPCLCHRRMELKSTAAPPLTKPGIES